MGPPENPAHLAHARQVAGSLFMHALPATRFRAKPPLQCHCHVWQPKTPAHLSQPLLFPHQPAIPILPPAPRGEAFPPCHQVRPSPPPGRGTPVQSYPQQAHHRHPAVQVQSSGQQGSPGAQHEEAGAWGQAGAGSWGLQAQPDPSPARASVQRRVSVWDPSWPSVNSGTAQVPSREAAYPPCITSLLSGDQPFTASDRTGSWICQPLPSLKALLAQCHGWHSGGTELVSKGRSCQGLGVLGVLKPRTHIQLSLRDCNPRPSVTHLDIQRAGEAREVF